MTDFQSEQFGQDIAYVVKNVPMLRAHVEARLAEMYNISVSSYGQDRSKRQKLATNCSTFPGAIICSLLKSDIASLLEEKNKYVALEKTDGVRYLLLLTTLNKIPYAILIDRKMEMRVVNLDFSIAAFEQEALFDGELAQNIENGLFYFLIFDLIYTRVKLLSGETLYKNAPYTLRMRQANYMLQTMWQKEIQTEAEYSTNNTPKQLKNTFFLKVKRYIPLCDFSKTYNQILEKNIWSHHGFRVDGFVFVRSQQKAEPFRNEEQFKYKPKHLHTIDVQIFNNNNGSYDLLIKNSRNSPQFYAKLCLCTENLDFLSQNAIKIEQFSKEKKNFIVECGWSDKEQTWILKNHRSDKQTPNALNTVEQTKKNIQEDIKLYELVQLFDKKQNSLQETAHQVMAHQFLNKIDLDDQLPAQKQEKNVASTVLSGEKGCFIHPSRLANIVMTDPSTKQLESENKKPVFEHKLSQIYEKGVNNECKCSFCDIEADVINSKDSSMKQPVLPQFSLQDLEKLLAKTSNVANLSLFANAASKT